MSSFPRLQLSVNATALCFSALIQNWPWLTPAVSSPSEKRVFVPFYWQPHLQLAAVPGTPPPVLWAVTATFSSPNGHLFVFLPAWVRHVHLAFQPPVLPCPLFYYFTKICSVNCNLGTLHLLFLQSLTANSFVPQSSLGPTEDHKKESIICYFYLFISHF